MLYDPMLVKPLRDEMVMMGAEELMSTKEVAAFLDDSQGLSLIFFNSTCCCAADTARPGLALSLEHSPSPKRVGSIFAGQDAEATKFVRERFPQYPASSPSILILNNGLPVDYIHRNQIDGQDPRALSETLIRTYERLKD